MRTIVIAVVATLAMSACQGDPEILEPDPSASAPTATPPTMPAQAREDSDEGRVAFVKHWIDVFNYASRGGDVEALGELSSTKCQSCTEYIDLYRDTYANGGYFKGGQWKVVDMAIEPDSPDEVFVRFRAEPAEYKANADARPRRGNSEDTTLVVEVSGRPDTREVSSLTRIES